MGVIPQSKSKAIAFEQMAILSAIDCFTLMITVDNKQFRLDQTQRFSMNHGMSPGRGMVFLINGNAFDPQRTDTQAQLNTVEDWEITNTGMFDHPFHLHTNYFQIISRNGQPETLNAWKDTVLVPIGETVRIRIPFRDFTGKTVYHCHILDHEDLGMMGVVEISG